MSFTKLVMGIATVSMFAASAAAAQPVTYSTTPSQLCVGSSGCGVLTQTIGGVNVLFNPVASSTVNPNPTTIASFGELVIACIGGGTGCGSQSLAGLSLYINITQTLPTGGSASLSGGSITGSVSGTASSAIITWSSVAPVSIGTVQYNILNSPLGLVPPSTNAGTTSVQGRITNTTVPEPSTYLLVAAGLATIGITARRRKQV